MSKILARALPALLGLFTLLIGLPQTVAAQTIVFTPQWTAQAQFAGYYVAAEKGFFREAGVKVEIKHPAATQSAMERLQEGHCQAITLQVCQALEEIDRGTPLVNILQTSMNNAMVIVSARGKNPLTQKGARVGIWNVGFGQLAICMNNKERLNYRWVRFAQGVKINEKDVYRFCEHGYNVQEDGVYMKRDYYETHRDESRRFAQACKKGWEWAAQHPEETLDIVMKYVEEGHIATNRIMQRLMLKEILRLQVDRESKKREFRLRPDMVRQASRLMAENKMLSREIKYEELIDNVK